MLFEKLRVTMLCLLSFVLCFPACGGGAEGEAESEAESESEGDCETQDCADGVDCTDDAWDEKECDCTFQPLHGRCDSGMICDPEKGCTSPPPCADAEDCPDLGSGNGVCLEESCSTATATCLYTPLDTDEDGHAPQICKAEGGDDCDDADDEIFPDAPEQCDGEDNDCDGFVDGQSEPCGTETGLCTVGTITCNMGDWYACTGVGPTAELCDGQDNDCDGETDEDWPILGDPCDGIDLDQCVEGVYMCNSSGAGITCTDSTASTTEVCGDFLDNDCDGAIDPDCWMTVSSSGAPSPRFRHTMTWTGSEVIIWGGQDMETGGYKSDGARYDPAADTWTAMTTVGAPDARSAHTAVWSGCSMIVWGGEDTCTGLSCVRSAAYDPVTDQWTILPDAGAPSSRAWHQAVWTGSEMIVWGGEFVNLQYDDGALYAPWNTSWAPIASSGAPSPRSSHVAVWTGSEMLNWGGYDSDRVYPYLNSGGRYDPEVDRWTAITSIDAPAGRIAFSGVWTGSSLIVWGGWNGTDMLASGGVYWPTSDSWTSMTTWEAPSARASFAAVWTGETLVFWGGVEECTPGPSCGLNDGGIYSLSTEGWLPVGGPVVLSGRWRHRAVWTGREMVIWGGWDGTNVLDDGARYVPPATTLADCGDGLCEAGETCNACPADCGVCSCTPSPMPCGDGICNGFENCRSCTPDCACICGDGLCDLETENEVTCAADCGCAAAGCGTTDPAPSGNCYCDSGCLGWGDCCSDACTICGICSVCGDWLCNGEERCETCPTDCDACPFCGDSICNGSEFCDDCPEDCGVCSPICGDGTCNGDETTCTCPEDCTALCGDGCCNGGETLDTCLSDCRTTTSCPGVSGGTGTADPDAPCVDWRGIYCCGPGDPCGWQSCYYVDDPCCEPADPCGWGNDGFCDCGGSYATTWDNIDCSDCHCWP